MPMMKSNGDVANYINNLNNKHINGDNLPNLNTFVANTIKMRTLHNLNNHNKLNRNKTKNIMMKVMIVLGVEETCALAAMKKKSSAS
jgi:hypothetical protein